MTETKQQKEERWKEIINIMKSLSIEERLNQNNHERSTYANDVERIVKIIQEAFTDEMLYVNRNLRKSLDQSVRQWVSIDEILDNEELKKSFQKIELYCISDRKTLKKLIRIQLKSRKSPLVCNRVALKRERPFINHLKTTKPIYIQNFLMESKMQSIFEYLRSITTIYKIDFHLDQKWALVYAEKPDRILADVAYRNERVLQIENRQEEDDEYMDELKVYSYQQYCLFLQSKQSKNYRYIVKNILAPFHIQYYERKLRQLQDEIQGSDNDENCTLTANIFQDPSKQLNETKMRLTREEYIQVRRKPKRTSEHKIRVEQKVALIYENFNNLIKPNFEFNAKHLSRLFEVKELENQERMSREQQQLIQAELKEKLGWVEDYNAKRDQKLREVEI